MLSRVVHLAKSATEGVNATVYVATDDQRIAEHCDALSVAHVMTRAECASGTDRVAEACAALDDEPDFILNMQGDAPLTPPHLLRAMIAAYEKQPADVVTPVRCLSWDGLNALREAKKITPFSGTCAVFHPDTHQAYWFSKNIIPAVRKEDAMRDAGEFSPVHQHIGLYGYAPKMLRAYATMPESHYEQLEGLEQLRLLEQGFTIRCVPVDVEGSVMSGVDSPEDIVRAETYLAEHGDPMDAA